MTIKDSLDLLARQVDLVVSMNTHTDEDKVYTATCNALRALNDLKTCLENIKDDLEESLLYCESENEKWYQKC